MPSYNPEKWCKKKGWSEPRKLENDIWVAFPPGGVIETPLPNQFSRIESQAKTNIVQVVLETTLLLLAVVVVGMITLIVSPYFLFPIIKKHKLRQSSNHHRKAN